MIRNPTTYRPLIAPRQRVQERPILCTAVEQEDDEPASVTTTQRLTTRTYQTRTYYRGQLQHSESSHGAQDARRTHRRAVRRITQP
jgi:hypothetical protein